MFDRSTETLSNYQALWRIGWIKLSLTIVCGLAIAYGVVAYTILPALWQYYEHNSKLVTSPKITRTAEGIPGDPIAFKTCFGIASSILLHRPYPKFWQ
jgi:predicted RND superfamily exporter protein